MPPKKSEECFAFPRRQFSINVLVLPRLRFAENEENRMKNNTPQGKLPPELIATPHEYWGNGVFTFPQVSPHFPTNFTTDFPSVSLRRDGLAFSLRQTERDTFLFECLHMLREKGLHIPLHGLPMQPRRDLHLLGQLDRQPTDEEVSRLV